MGDTHNGAGTGPTFETVSLSDGVDVDLTGFDDASTQGGAAGAADNTNAQNQGQPDGQAAEKKPEQTDPEKLVAEASALFRKANAAVREANFKASRILQNAKQQAQGYDDYRQLTQTARQNPLAALAKLADHVGLDVDSAIDALTVKRAGGEPQLTEAQRLERLEKQRQEDAEKAEKERQEQDAAAKKREQEQAYGKALDSFKNLVGDGTKFPLIAEDTDTYVREALDLQALYWVANKEGQLGPDGQPVQPITQIQALNLIEKTLRQQTDARAKKLGYRPAELDPSKADPATTSETRQAQEPPRVAAPASPPPARVAQPSSPTPVRAPVMERASAIKSDEEILAEFGREFSGR